MKKQFFHKKNGFTLVELMAVIAIMAILAAAGAAGVTNFVPGFQQKACADERRQAVRAFVSDWLETRTVGSPSSAAGDSAEKTAAENWLKSYLSSTQVNCGSTSVWEITLEKNSSDYTVKITCGKHSKNPEDPKTSASATFGRRIDEQGGIGWDGGFEPVPKK